MKNGFVLQPKIPTAKPEPSFTRPSARILQRKCACGGMVVAGGECAECRKKRLQTNPAVNQPGDRLEHEADRMADFVTRGGKQAPVLSDGSLGALQRDEPNTSSASTSAPSIVDEVLEGSGQPLDSSTRAFMERRFGHDFGNVRVHFDARAGLPPARSTHSLTRWGTTLFSATARLRPTIRQAARSSRTSWRMSSNNRTHTLRGGSFSVSRTRLQPRKVRPLKPRPPRLRRQKLRRAKR